MTLQDRLSEIEGRSEKATPGPWRPCFHLIDNEHDKKCSCGFAGDVWSSDGEKIIFSMGVPHIDPSSEMAPRLDRVVEIDTAHFLVAARTDIPKLVKALRVSLRGLDCCSHYEHIQSVKTEVHLTLTEIERILNAEGER